MKPGVASWLLSLACASGAAAQEANLPGSADLHVGDRWMWRTIDNLTNQVTGDFTRLVSKTDGEIEFQNGRRNRTFTQAQMYVTGYGDNPSRPWRVWPLALGKQWQFATGWTSPAGLPGTVDQTARVVAYEAVDVPAGHFMAFKIEMTGYWHVMDPSHMQYEGPQYDAYWYAPEARMDVKHVRTAGGNRFTQELVSFSPGGP